MAKLMAFRFEPGMGLILEEIADDLKTREVRRVTKTEVIERAVAAYRSLLVFGNIAVLDEPEIKEAYRASLARVQGLSIEEKGENK